MVQSNLFFTNDASSIVNQPFVVLTTNVSFLPDGVTYTYAFTEQSINIGTGQYEDAPSARVGFVSGGPYLVELNNVQLKPPFYALVKLRNFFDGTPTYEFSAYTQDTALACLDTPLDASDGSPTSASATIFGLDVGTGEMSVEVGIVTVYNLMDQAYPSDTWITMITDPTSGQYFVSGVVGTPCSPEPSSSSSTSVTSSGTSSATSSGSSDSTSSGSSLMSSSSSPVSSSSGGIPPNYTCIPFQTCNGGPCKYLYLPNFIGAIVSSIPCSSSTTSSGGSSSVTSRSSSSAPCSLPSCISLDYQGGKPIKVNCDLCRNQAPSYYEFNTGAFGAPCTELNGLHILKYTSGCTWTDINNPGSTLQLIPYNDVYNCPTCPVAPSSWIWTDPLNGNNVLLQNISPCLWEAVVPGVASYVLGENGTGDIPFWYFQGVYNNGNFFEYRLPNSAFGCLSPNTLSDNGPAGGGQSGGFPHTATIVPSSGIAILTLALAGGGYVSYYSGLQSYDCSGPNTFNLLDETFLCGPTYVVVSPSTIDPNCVGSICMNYDGLQYNGSVTIQSVTYPVTLSGTLNYLPNGMVMTIGGVPYYPSVGSKCTTIVFNNVTIGNCIGLTVTVNAKNLTCCPSSSSSSSTSLISSGSSTSSSSACAPSCLNFAYSGTTQDAGGTCAICNNNAPAFWNFVTASGIDTNFYNVGNCVWQTSPADHNWAPGSELTISSSGMTVTLIYANPPIGTVVYSSPTYTCNGNNSLTWQSGPNEIPDKSATAYPRNNLTTCSGSVCLNGPGPVFSGYATIGDDFVYIQVQLLNPVQHSLLIVTGTPYIADSSSTCGNLIFKGITIGSCLNMGVLVTNSGCCVSSSSSSTSAPSSSSGSTSSTSASSLSSGVTSSGSPGSGPCGCIQSTTTNAFTTPGAISWTAPAGVTQVFAQVWGGGAGGGNETTGPTGGGNGGGGGGYASGCIPVIPGDVYNIVVGNGGIGAIPFESTDGDDGGDSSFDGIGASSISATGGSGTGGGTGTTSGASNGYTSTGGAGGAGAGVVPGGGGGGGGGAGASGNGMDGLPAIGTLGGYGGLSDTVGIGGDGGNGTGPSAGLPGTGVGSGGGGGGIGQTNADSILKIGGQIYSAAGGNGAAGQVILTYCVSTSGFPCGCSSSDLTTQVLDTPTPSGMWTCPANVFWIYAIAVGGGGLGVGSCDATACGGTGLAGGGGGAGGYASGCINVTPGMSYNYTVGDASNGSYRTSSFTGDTYVVSASNGGDAIGQTGGLASGSSEATGPNGTVIEGGAGGDGILNPTLDVAGGGGGGGVGGVGGANGTLIAGGAGGAGIGSYAGTGGQGGGIVLGDYLGADGGDYGGGGGGSGVFIGVPPSGNGGTGQQGILVLMWCNG